MEQRHALFPGGDMSVQISRGSCFFWILTISLDNKDLAGIIDCIKYNFRQSK